MTFEQFKAIAADLEENGSFSVTRKGEKVELNELDLAVMYAIGTERGKTGINGFSPNQVAQLIKKHCGEAVYNRLFEEG